MTRKAKVPAVRKQKGPPSTFDEGLGAEICVRVAMGETLKGICRPISDEERTAGVPENTMPPLYTVRKWLGRFPDFHKLYHNARQQQSHALFDQVVDISMGLIDQSRREPGMVYRDREVATAIRGLQWAAGKLNPGEYGERSLIDPGVAIHIETTLDMAGGSQPVAGGKTIYTVEAAPLETATQKAERMLKEEKDGKKAKPKLEDRRGE